jgi:hypothetical protein
MREKSKEHFKESIQEIREVDEEYLYSSGVQSSKNTDRLLSENPSAFHRQFSNSNSNQNLENRLCGDINVQTFQNLSFPVSNSKMLVNQSINEKGKQPVNLDTQNADQKFDEKPDNVNILQQVQSAQIETFSKVLVPLGVGKQDQPGNKENLICSNRINQRSMSGMYPVIEYITDSPCHNNFGKGTVGDQYKAYSSAFMAGPCSQQLETFKKKIENNTKMFLKEKRSVDYTAHSGNVEIANGRCSSKEKSGKFLKKFVSNKELNSGTRHEGSASDPNTFRDPKRNYASFHSHSTNKPSPHHTQNSSQGFIGRNLKKGVSNNKESLLKKENDENLLKLGGSVIPRLTSKAEAPIFFRKSEDKTKLRTVSQTTTFNQLIQNLKRANLKSPKKFHSSKI